jgi:hypothetical protein
LVTQKIKIKRAKHTVYINAVVSDAMSDDIIPGAPWLIRIRADIDFRNRKKVLKGEDEENIINKPCRRLDWEEKFKKHRENILHFFST